MTVSPQKATDPSGCGHAGGAWTVERVFVYGTLMEGFARRALLGAALLEGRASVRGSLVDLGAYPGLVLDDGGWVWGELYRVPDLDRRVHALDRAEWYDPADPARSLYVRRCMPVQPVGGPPLDAWLYVYNGRSDGRGRIACGDWRRHLALGLTVTHFEAHFDGGSR